MKTEKVLAPNPTKDIFQCLFCKTPQNLLTLTNYNLLADPTLTYTTRYICTDCFKITFLNS